MGCAPSKQNAEFDDPETRPLPIKEKKSPKDRKSPKKDKKKEHNELVENNIVPETIIAAESAPVGSAVPSGQNGHTTGTLEPEVEPAEVEPQDDEADGASSSVSSPRSPIMEKYGEIWDMTRGMPKATSPYDEEGSPPPKPERTYHHTFPRQKSKERPQSARERYLEEADAKNTLERKISLRECTPERRKDLDLSGNLYMGKNVEQLLSGRGHMIDTENVDFLQMDSSKHEDNKERIPASSVKDRAQMYLEHVTKKKDQEVVSKSPLHRPIRKLHEEPNEESDTIIEESMMSGDGNISVIEVVNMEILDDYHELPKKTFEEIDEERMKLAAEEAEREMIRLEEEERIRAEEEEKERIRLEEEAKIRAEEEEKERLRLEEEEKIRAEEEERERLRLEEEARIQAEEEEKERIRLEEEARVHEEEEKERLHNEEMNEREVEVDVHETEGGEEAETDPAEKGAELEDRFYNNKAFDKPDIDSSNPEQQDAALKIQTKYRQHHAKDVVKEKREEKAAVKIQAGYRGFRDRKRVQDIRSDSDQQSAAQAEEAQADDARGDDINYDDPQVIGAATTIQAGFKGYKARKEVQELKDKKSQEQESDEVKTEEKSEEPAQKSSETGPDVPPTVEVTEEQTDEQAAEPTEDKQDEYSAEQHAAAAKIQAGARGYMGRKRVKAIKDGKATSLPEPGQESADEPKEEPSDEPQEVKEDAGDAAPEEEQNDLNDPEQDKAAAKIQAGYRGMRDRKRVKDIKSSKETENAEEKSDEKTEPTNLDAPAEPTADMADNPEEVDIDLNDPEVNAAAIKIQAGFKGYKTRKDLADKKGEESGKDDKETGQDAEESPKDEENDESPKEQEDEAEKKEGEEEDKKEEEKPTEEVDGQKAD